jgi:hypothetical protein
MESAVRSGGRAGSIEIGPSESFGGESVVEDSSPLGRYAEGVEASLAVGDHRSKRLALLWAQRRREIPLRITPETCGTRQRLRQISAAKDDIQPQECTTFGF